jgi:hypothetical protein
LRIAAVASRGATTQPMRQPVIEKVFDAPETVMVRSRIPGSAARHTCSPS